MRSANVQLFFSLVECRRLSSTSPDSFVDSIESGYAAIDDLSCAWGKDNKDSALGAYKQEWPEIRHSFDEVTMSVLL